MYDDYFQTKPLFPPRLFRRCFRMCRRLFNLIRKGVVESDDYFRYKYDCTGKVGFSSYHKCTTTIRMLPYEVPGDLVDKYVRMSESTCMEVLYIFCNVVVQVF